MTETKASPPIRWRRLRRVADPAGLVLALSMFFFGFVGVSCSTPGGFGRGSAGATTTYSGVTLLTGGSPSVTADHLVPLNESLPDRVGPIVWLVAAVVFVLLAIGASWALARRHEVIGCCASAGAIAIGVGGWQSWRTVVDLVAEQVTSRLGPGQKPSQFVQMLPPYWVAMGLVTVVAIVHGIASIRDAQRPTTDVTTALPPGREAS